MSISELVSYVVSELVEFAS